MEGTIMLSKNEQYTSRIIEDFRAGRIKRKEAALLLGVTERTITNIAARVRKHGVAGIKHGNSKKRPSNKIDPSLKEAVLQLASNKYRDFNRSHCLELLRENEGYDIGYATFWRWCDETKLKKSRTRRKAKNHIHRDRMANEGLLLQMDGSHHKWNGKDDWCLISAIDDATSNIPYAEFFKGETTWNCMTVLRKIIELRGVPEAIYVDRAGWAGGGKRQHFSHFVTACDVLGIRVIPAYSPQAKGRIERSFRTFQDRLVPELKFKKIRSMEKANRYLQDEFLEKYWNVRNVVQPREEETRYHDVPKNIDLNLVFCKIHERQIRNDLTFFFEGKLYRLKKPLDRPMKGKEISIRVFQNGRWSAYFEEEPLEYEEVLLPFRGRKNG